MSGRGRRVKSNLVRCPFLKITTTETLKDGTVVKSEEFNDCYKTFCAAWDDETKKCHYFPTEDEEDDDDDSEEDNE